MVAGAEGEGKGKEGALAGAGGGSGHAGGAAAATAVARWFSQLCCMLVAVAISAIRSAPPESRKSVEEDLHCIGKHLFKLCCV